MTEVEKDFIVEAGFFSKDGIELAESLEAFLETVKDEDSEIVAGCSHGRRELWVMCKGRQYMFSFREEMALN